MPFRITTGDIVITMWIIVVGFLTTNWNKHYMKTKDTSLQGFYEYMKDKYWNKKDNDKREP